MSEAKLSGISLRKNFKRLSHRRRFLRLKIERRRLERELAGLRRVYLAERSEQEPTGERLG